MRKVVPQTHRRPLPYATNILWHNFSKCGTTTPKTDETNLEHRPHKATPSKSSTPKNTQNRVAQLSLIPSYQLTRTHAVLSNECCATCATNGPNA